MTITRSLGILLVVIVFTAAVSGCGGYSQNDMRKYASAGSGGDDDDDDGGAKPPPKKPAKKDGSKEVAKTPEKPAPPKEKAPEPEEKKEPEEEPKREPEVEEEDEHASDKEQSAVGVIRLPGNRKPTGDDDDDGGPSKPTVRINLPPAPKEDDDEGFNPNNFRNRQERLRREREAKRNPRQVPTGRPGSREIVLLKPPAKKDLDKAVESLREIYQSTWDKAKTKTERTKFAGELLKKARNYQDATVAFALYQTARRVAAHAGDLSLALQCVDATKSHFEVDEYKLKLDAAETVMKYKDEDKKARGAKDQALVTLAEELFEEALSRDEFEVATKMHSFRSAAVRKGQAGSRARNRDDKSSLELGLAKRRLDTAKAEYKKMKKSLDRMSGASQAEMATVLGRYQCFVKENWARGLTLLAEGSDQETSEIAKQEIEGSPSANAWIAIGDLWWDYGEDNDEHQRAIRLHAVYIYSRAIPDAADSVEKLRAEVRVKQATDLLGAKVVDELVDRMHRAFETPELENTSLSQ